MKVLMVGNDLSVKGGITSVISQLLDYDWNRDGIQMSFIPTYVEENSVKKILFFFASYHKIKKELKYTPPDIVHIHMSYKGSFIRKLLIHKLCRRNHIPDIIHLHGSEFKKWYDSANKKKQSKIRELLRECNVFVVLGDKWNQIIKDIEPQTNTLVVRNMVSVPESSVRWHQPFKVLFMGVLIRRKGVEDLINAVTRLKSVGKLKNTKFVIAGSGTEEANLKSMCKKQHLENEVEFVGWINGEKKKKLFSECQMLVLPSYNEGLPIAILEAISYGMPVVATDVGDISSAVINGRNGYLIQPGDVKQLANCLACLIYDQERYQLMSEQSKKIAINQFSDKYYFVKLKECYLRTKEVC